MTATNSMLAPMLAMLKDNGYKNIRVLDDGTIVGTLDLLFTRAVCIDLNEMGWGSRYCYPDRDLAVKACNAMVDGDHPPLLGYVAQRGKPL